MKKLVIIINGKGGCGKDTLCDFAAERFNVINVSYVTPVKEIASNVFGWNGSKDDQSRKMLSDLDDFMEEHYNKQYEYIQGVLNDFINTDKQIMFIHARKAHVIKKLVSMHNWDDDIKCVTLLITTERIGRRVYDNRADDDIDRWVYDYKFYNDYPLNETESQFNMFIKHIWKEEFGEII